jgi:hypothetical protein
MDTITLTTKSARCAWWAAKDARMRSTVNSSLWGQRDKTRAERMRVALEEVYTASAIYIAYGRRGISIKVNRAQVKDDHALSLLEAEWTSLGVEKRVSTQGVIYRFS